MCLIAETWFAPNDMLQSDNQMYLDPRELGHDCSARVLGALPYLIFPDALSLSRLMARSVLSRNE